MKRSMVDNFFDDTDFQYINKQADTITAEPIHQPLDFPSSDNSVKNGAIAGMIGSFLGNLFNKNKKSDTLPVKSPHGFNDNFYTQTDNVINNLKVTFTPLSVVFSLSDKGKLITFDTIETGEMTDSMKNAWRHKDTNYFASLLLNKMYSEMSLAEQGFARELLQKEMEAKRNLSKQASYDVEEFNGLDLTLPRPFDKYAEECFEKLSFFGCHNKQYTSSEQRKMLQPHYLSNNVRIGFMPDRVLFIVDNNVLGAMHCTQMNEEGYKHFTNNNKDYFKKVFKQQVNEGLKSMKEKTAAEVQIDTIQPGEDNLADDDIKNIFQKTNIHPVIYYKLLTDKYGQDWFNFDLHALIKIIEDDFGLDEIGDIALNKIMSIQVLNKKDTIVYDSCHAFEKIMRSFINKPIDFLKREDDDIDIDDIAFCIDVMDRVTPNDDVYELLGPNIFDYIVSALSKREIYLFSPTEIVGSPTEPKFNILLNYSLLNAINKHMLRNITDHIIEQETIEKNEAIFNTSKLVINAFRSQQAKYKLDVVHCREFAKRLLHSLRTRPDIRELVIKQMVRNVALDEFLKRKESLLINQAHKYLKEEL